MNKKNYNKPQAEIVNFIYSENVLGYGVGEGSTGEQLGKGATRIDVNENEEETNASIWDD